MDETYSGGAKVTLPDSLPDGPYYLIFKTDDTGLQVESDEGNNTEVIPLCIKPSIQLTAPFCGIFVDPTTTLGLGWTDIAESVSAFVNIAIDTDTDPTNGYTPLFIGRSGRR